MCLWYLTIILQHVSAFPNMPSSRDVKHLKKISAHNTIKYFLFVQLGPLLYWLFVCYKSRNYAKKNCKIQTNWNILWAGIAQSVQRLATGCTVRGSNPSGGGEIFQTGPGAHPASYTIGTESFPGVKRPGRGVDHTPQLAPRLRKEYSYISTPPLGLRGLL
jgi:hypothetical protein